MIQPKLPHPEPRAHHVLARAGLQLVQEWVLRRPEPATTNGNAQLHSPFGLGVEPDLFRAALAGRLARARLAHLEAQLCAGHRAGIPHHRLHANGFAGDFRRHLHVDNVRRPGQNQLHRIKDARDVPALFEIPARRHSRRQRLARRPNPHDQLVLCPVPAQRRPRVEVARRETGQMLAQQHPIQDHARPIRRLVNLEQRHRRHFPFDSKRPPIPKRLASRASAAQLR